MVGCRVGAKNTLLKNYLWFAEKAGAEVMADQMVTDIRPLGASDGSDGYTVRTRRPGIFPGRSELVRTNSESILAVTMPDDSHKLWNSVAISSSIHTDQDTHIEVVTYGQKGDSMRYLFTLLTGPGTRWTRVFSLLGNAVRHPLDFAKTLWPFGWSRRTIALLVMQSLDNAISFRAKKRWFSRKVRLSTEQNPDMPNPTYIEAGRRQPIFWEERR